jgi:hypothetical protein
MVIMCTGALGEVGVVPVPTVIGIVAVTPSQVADTVTAPDVEPAVTSPVEEIVATLVFEVAHLMMGLVRSPPEAGS